MTSTQIEAAARYLCTLRGIEPAEHPSLFLAAELEVRARLQLDEALAVVQWEGYTNG